MSRSQGATPALKGGGTIVTTRASVLGASDKEPAVGDRRDFAPIDSGWGRARDIARSGSARNAAQFKPRAQGGPAWAVVRSGAGRVTAR